MGVNQTGQYVAAGGVNMLCLRILIEQCRIARSDNFAIFRNDENAKCVDAGLSRGIAGETVEYSFRSVCRPAKTQEKNCSKLFNLDFRSPDSVRSLSFAKSTVRISQ